MKRGLAYKCKLCDWKGDKFLRADHYARVHCTLETAPYSCRSCNFVAGMESKLEKHLSTAKHKERARGRPESEVTHRKDPKAVDQLVSPHFTTLSQQESQKVWTNRKGQSAATSTTMTPEQQRLLSQFTQKLLSGDVDQLEAAMAMSGIPVISTEKGKAKQKKIRKSRVIVSSDESSDEEEQNDQSETEDDQCESRTKDQDDSEEARSNEQEKEYNTQETQSAGEGQPPIEKSPRENAQQEEYIVVIERGEGLDSEDASTTGTEQRAIEGRSRSPSAKADQKRPHTHDQDNTSLGKENQRPPTEERNSKKRKHADHDEASDPKSVTSQPSSKRHASSHSNEKSRHKEIASYKIPRVAEKRKAEESDRNQTTTGVKRLKLDDYKKRKDQEKNHDYEKKNDQKERGNSRKQETAGKKHENKTLQAQNAAEIVESEGQFVPDYDEEIRHDNRARLSTQAPRDQPSYTNLIQQMKRELIEPLCQQLKESVLSLPAAMLTSMNSVASLYRTSNGNILDLVRKLDTSTTQQQSSTQASQAINRDMRNELRNLNQNINLEHGDLTKLHHSMQELAVNIKHYTAKNETLITCFTKQMDVMSQAITTQLKHFSTQGASHPENRHVMPIPFVPLPPPPTRHLGAREEQRIARNLIRRSISRSRDRAREPLRYNQHRYQ